MATMTKDEKRNHYEFYLENLMTNEIPINFELFWKEYGETIESKAEGKV